MNVVPRSCRSEFTLPPSLLVMGPRVLSEAFSMVPLTFHIVLYIRCVKFDPMVHGRKEINQYS